MTPEVERFLDLATRELESYPEQRGEAKGELMARLSHRMGGVEAIDIGEPLAVLEKKGKPASWKKFGTAILLLTLLFSLGLTGFRHLRSYLMLEDSGEFDSSHRYGEAIDLSGRPLVRMLREESPDLPIGLDSERFEKASDESAAIRERFPDDAGALRMHVWNLLTERNYEWERLPPEILGQVERIEVTPYWADFRISRNSRKAFEDLMGRNTGTVRDWDLWEEARALWKEIVASAEIADAPNLLYRKQVEALPDSEDFVSMMINHNCRRAAINERSSVLNLFNFIRAEADLFHDKENREGLLQLSREVRKVISFRVDPLVQWRGSYVYGAENPLIDHLKYEAGSGIFDTGNEAFDAELKEWDRLSTVYSDVHASGVTWTDEVIQAVPLILEHRVGDTLLIGDIGEFKALRMAEYSFAERLAAIAGAVVFSLFVLLVGLDVIRRSKWVRGLARGVKPLFGWVDQWWVGALGILVPFACWLAVRLSPLGMRDFGIAQDEGLPWLLQTIAAMLFCLAMLVATVRWRWSKRAGFLDIGGGIGVKLGWVAAGLIGLAMIAFGGIRYVDDIDNRREIFLLAVASMGGFGVLWILWLAFAAVCQSSQRALSSHLAGLTLLPWLAGVALGLLALEPLLHLEEKYWFVQDVILRPMDGQFDTVYEERTTLRLAEALKE
ncbi:hypothetical protein ACFQY0_10240 [Haloferula chungangensis]|uniref:DUF3376 domain-containing protein n=1 Tax=Haloferula chungangensis TaxID=1048331 RepID=A0ABW2L7S7_9BACT